MAPLHPDLSLSNPQPRGMNTAQKLGAAAVGIGLTLLMAAAFGAQLPGGGWLLAAALALLTAGTMVFARGAYLHLPAGIKNNGVWQRNLSNRGL